MTTKPAMDDLFERRLTYPDVEAQARLARLVGLDDQKTRLAKILGLVVNPTGLAEWAKRHHPGAETLLDAALRRPPLVVLAGDVGSGKTELAETIGDAAARQERIDITLLPLSLSTRGQGRVGEMTQLLSAAFRVHGGRGYSPEVLVRQGTGCRDPSRGRGRRARAVARGRADAS